MRKLTARHLPVNPSGGDPRLLPPYEQWYREQQDSNANDRDHNMKISYAHTGDPWSERKENDNRQDVPHEDYPD